MELTLNFATWFQVANLAAFFPGRYFCYKFFVWTCIFPSIIGYTITGGCGQTATFLCTQNWIYRDLSVTIFFPLTSMLEDKQLILDVPMTSNLIKLFQNNMHCIFPSLVHFQNDPWCFLDNLFQSLVHNFSLLHTLDSE